MNKNLLNSINGLFTTDEILRVFDLALRRVVDNGEENYSQEEQKVFNYIRDIKLNWGAGKLG